MWAAGHHRGMGKKAHGELLYCVCAQQRDIKSSPVKSSGQRARSGLCTRAGRDPCTLPAPMAAGLRTRPESLPAPVFLRLVAARPAGSALGAWEMKAPKKSSARDSLATPL